MSPVTRVIEDRRAYVQQELCRLTRVEWLVSLTYCQYTVSFTCIAPDTTEYVTREVEAETVFSLGRRALLDDLVETVAQAYFCGENTNA